MCETGLAITTWHVGARLHDVNQIQVGTGYLCTGFAGFCYFSSQQIKLFPDLVSYHSNYSPDRQYVCLHVCTALNGVHVNELEITDVNALLWSGGFV